jgi:2-oxoglutarate ferredoxin oxidoreductase subunit alpha
LLFKNIVYVGALAYLLGMGIDVYVDLISDKFKGKEKLIIPNVKALEMGYNYAKANLTNQCDIKVRKSNKNKGMILIMETMLLDWGVFMLALLFVLGTQLHHPLL